MATLERVPEGPRRVQHVAGESAAHGGATAGAAAGSEGETVAGGASPRDVQRREGPGAAAGAPAGRGLCASQPHPGPQRGRERSEDPARGIQRRQRQGGGKKENT